MARDEPVKPQPSRVGKKSLSVFVQPNIWRELKMVAAKHDTTIDRLIRRGIDMVLAEYRARDK